MIVTSLFSWLIAEQPFFPDSRLPIFLGEALRRARVKILHNQSFSHPYFWIGCDRVDY